MDPGYPFQNKQPQQDVKAGVGRRILSKRFIWMPLGLVILLIIGAVVYGMISSESNTDLPQAGDKTVAENKDDFDSEPTNVLNQGEEESPKDTSENQQRPRNNGSSAGGGVVKPGTISPGLTIPPSVQPNSGSTPNPNNPPDDSEEPPAPPSSPEKPNSSNTGPRYAIQRDLTPDQALNELRQTGYLSQVRIRGIFKLSGNDGRNWVIEDSVFETGGLYGIQSYSSLTSFTGTYAERPIIRYVEIMGRAARGTGSCEANVYGGNIVLQNVDIYGCKDGVKPSSNVDILNSWIHDNDHPAGAHCDTIQITRGSNIIVRGSRLDAYVGYVSDGSSIVDGDTCNAALQTGAATGNISATFENNWFSGGHYTIRGWNASDETAGSMSYTFKNNKWMRNGTSVPLGRTDLAPNAFGATTGRLGTLDASNVWEDTGLPVRN